MYLCQLEILRTGFDPQKPLPISLAWYLRPHMFLSMNLLCTCETVLLSPLQSLAPSGVCSLYCCAPKHQDSALPLQFAEGCRYAGCTRFWQCLIPTFQETPEGWNIGCLFGPLFLLTGSFKAVAEWASGWVCIHPNLPLCIQLPELLVWAGSLPGSYRVKAKTNPRELLSFQMFNTHYKTFLPREKNLAFGEFWILVCLFFFFRQGNAYIIEWMLTFSSP